MSEFNQRLVILALFVICIGGFAFLNPNDSVSVTMACITGLAGMYQQRRD